MPRARNQLVAARKKAGLSQGEIARRVGVSRQFYSMVENGVKNPSLEVAFRIADALGADPRELFGDVLTEKRVKSA